MSVFYLSIYSFITLPQVDINYLDIDSHRGRKPVVVVFPSMSHSALLTTHHLRPIASAINVGCLCQNVVFLITLINVHLCVYQLCKHYIILIIFVRSQDETYLQYNFDL